MISAEEDDMATPIENIGQIAIRARDLPAAVAFYRDVLGLEYLFEAGTLAFFMCGDVRLMLGVPENDAVDHESSTVYFRVARPPGRLRGAVGARRELRRRAAPDRRAARPRAVDGVLPRPRRQPHGADERGQGKLSTADSSSPRSSGTVTLTSEGSAWRAAEYGWSSSWERTLSAITSAPGSSFSRASPNSAS